MKKFQIRIPFQVRQSGGFDEVWETPLSWDSHLVVEVRARDEDDAVERFVDALEKLLSS